MPPPVNRIPDPNVLRKTILAFVFSLAPCVSLAYDASSMVVSSSGTLPLILTVPHDGDELLGSVPARQKGTVLRDAGTRALAERTAAAVEKRTGKRPYLVIARFSRKYLDANRTERDAMESVDALPAYRAYHDQIAAYIADVKSKFPGGAVLVDVHGQSDDPDTIFRGTRSGLTAKALLQRSGRACLQGDKSITGVLAAKGYAVNPPADAESLREDPRFMGGYTVFNYGSQHARGVDAIQLEFGKNHRANERLPEDLAEALVVFMTQCGLLSR
jgi:N-formylglutamate amidohydrolase